MFLSAACADDCVPRRVREVQQAERGQQPVSELWKRRSAVSVSAGLAVVSNPPTPHSIPALPWTEQSASKLLQTGNDGESAARGDAAHADPKHPGNAAASEQRQAASVSRDVELLRKPTQREEDIGTAARPQRPQ